MNNIQKNIDKAFEEVRKYTHGKFDPWVYANLIGIKIAVIEQAVKDLYSDSRFFKTDAEQYLVSEKYEKDCELIGVSKETMDYIIKNIETTNLSLDVDDVPFE